LFLGGGGTPGGDGEKLVDDVVGFTATIWAAGEGEIVGRYAVREIEGAADLLGRVDSTSEFVYESAVLWRHLGDGLAVLDLDGNLLHDGGAIEAVAGLLPLLALELVEGASGAGDGQFRLGFLFPGALATGEILKDAFQGALGGGFVAVEEREFVEGFGRPESGIGLGSVERGFDGV